jgi:hypothetical protein
MARILHPHESHVRNARPYRRVPFAQKSFSIVLDTHIRGEQARAEVSPCEAGLPLRSPSAVSLKAKLRIER